MKKATKMIIGGLVVFGIIGACSDTDVEDTKEEEKFMALVAKLKYENKHEYSKFMTKGQMLNVRWDLMKYLTNANIDVYYTQGLVVIH